MLVLFLEAYEGISLITKIKCFSSGLFIQLLRETLITYYLRTEIRYVQARGLICLKIFNSNILFIHFKAEVGV